MVASRIFRSLNLDRSMGWNRTMAKIGAGDLDFSDAETDLREALEEHIMCGEKLVRFYALNDGAAETIRQRARAAAVAENEFSEQFPVLASGAMVDQLRQNGPTVTGVKEYDDGIAIFLSSARYLMKRSILDLTDVPEAAAAEFGDYEQLIGVKHERIQAVDVLWVSKMHDIAELRIDFPLGMLQRQAEIAADIAITNFTALVGQAAFAQQINLFPVIQSLYNRQGDGRMVELGFMVSGSAQKLEKTRRDTECCREEAYHIGGVSALETPIAPYRTSVMWTVPIGDEVSTEPEATLRGESKQTLETEPFLGDLIVRNCANMLDYGHLRDRILDHAGLFQ